MAKKIIFSEQFRLQIWDELSEEDFVIRNLKGMVQNEMPIRQEDMESFYSMINCGIKKLNAVNDKLTNEYLRLIKEK